MTENDMGFGKKKGSLGRKPPRAQNDQRYREKRVIMAPKNESVHGLNNILIERLPGELKVYKSVDTTVEANDACHFPSEVLNKQDPPGLPPHELKIKVGCPIMLLRNLDAPKMVNGTRLMNKTLS